MNLASHFVSCGFIEWNDVFYLAIKNDEGKTMKVNFNIIFTWSNNWMKADKEFQEFLKTDPNLRDFSKKIFFVWDENHRLQA